MDGKLFALDRDLAKRVFACKDDNSIGDLVTELIEQPASDSSTSLSEYQRLAAVYETMAASSEASGLGFAILGGRSIHQGPKWLIRLVRPDIVRGLAAELGQIDSQSQAELTDPELQREHQSLTDFYAKAAASNSAVLFAASTS